MQEELFLLQVLESQKKAAFQHLEEKMGFGENMTQ